MTDTATQSKPKPVPKTAAKGGPRPAKKTGLGKGLSALVTSTDDENNEEFGQNSIHEIKLDRIKPGRYQPRHMFDNSAISELADSIRKSGVMQPIVLRRIDGETRMEIIAGERRWRAAKEAGLETIPAIVRDLSDSDALELSLIENIQRQDLTPLEEAQGYQRLMDEFAYKQDEIARIIGKSRSHIANMLRLLGLPEDVKTFLEKGQLTMGHARALIGVENAAAIAGEIVKRGLNVRQAERLAKQGLLALTEKAEERLKHKKAPAPKPAPAPLAEDDPAEKDEDILALERALSENIGLDVHIRDRGQNGELVIRYHNLNQLDDILRRLGGAI